MKTPPGPRTSDAVIYLPGIMGSELVDSRGHVVWGLKPSLVFRQVILGDVLDRLALKPGDDIRASRPLQFPVALPRLSSAEPYRALEHRLKTVVVQPEAVSPFAYDWRRSIADAAQKLAPFAREHLASWRRHWKMLDPDEQLGLSEPGLTLVGHSMGGLVASYFAAFGDGGEAVKRVVTLGTPFGGSMNAVNVLATGKQFKFGAFASSLRDAVRTMPGLYELVARWKCVVEDGSLRRLTPGDLEGIGANRELAEKAAAVIDGLDHAFSDQAERKVPIRCLVGTTQPTLQSVSFSAGDPDFSEAIAGTDHRGDGTVFRHAALPPGVEPSYVPQGHGALAKTTEGVEYVAAVLTERELGAFMAPQGIGLRVPELVQAGVPFSVDVLDGEPGTMCQLYDAEEDRLMSMAQAEKRDDSTVATFEVPRAGLYRVAAAGGGLSPVEQLVVAIG